MERYEAISATSSEMAAAARAGDWDAVVSAQSRCAEMVEAMRNLPEPKLDDEQRRRWIELVRKLLAEDAEVRELAQHRMTDLDGLLRDLRQGRELDRLYR